MSLTKVSYSMIYGAPVNVLDYGADKSGVADSTTAIQAAINAGTNIYFPSGTYLITAPLRIVQAVFINGDQDVTIKASASFTGISVTKNSAPYVLEAIFAVFTGTTIDTISGTRIGENGVGVRIGNITLDCNSNSDYGVWIERCPGAYVAVDVLNSTNAINVGPYCWSIILDNNRIFRCVNTGIFLGFGANGAVISHPEIWGETVTTSIGIESNGNNNGVLISGGYIETCATGIYLKVDSGPHTIIGIDFEVISEHCIRGEKSGGDTRSMGPVTVQNCYLASTDAEIYNKGYRFIVSGNRFRNPSTTTGSHYTSVNSESIFVLDANSYDTSNGVIIPENLDGTASVTSSYIDGNALIVTNKKFTEASGAYATNWALKNYTSVNQPLILSSSEEFQNSRQGGATLLYSSKWKVTVNETNTDPTPQILYTAGVSLQSLAGLKSFTPIADNTHTLGNASFRWSVVYAGTGAINTSDEREKQDIANLDAAERRVAISLKSLVKKFRFKDAVLAKGEIARIHVGVIAQEVILAFQAEGLDPMRYAIICYDEWDSELDENGNEVMSAGNRYGVRYDELLAFIIASI
jgi:hypothetical protein